MPIFHIDMSKRKKKSSAADKLIDSLMDDLKDIREDTSFNSGIHTKAAKVDEENLLGIAAVDSDENRVEGENPAADLWNELKSTDDQDSILESAGNFIEVVPDIDLPYQGPSADVGYQSPDEIFSGMAKDKNAQVVSASDGDKTVSIQQDLNVGSSVVTVSSDNEKTLAVEGFANARLGGRKSPDVDVKVSVGNFRGNRSASSAMTSMDASLVQAESLRFAQQRILDLEKEVEHLRADNEELATAGEIVRSRMDELMVRVSSVEKEKTEIEESAKSEVLILKGNLQYKENEVAKARIKVDELEARLKSDFKKIRVRERELENRLELLRAEKSALVRSKDEYILEQKRKIDQLSQELDNYRKKCLDLNKTIEANQDQVKRTERALRLALTNLEVKEENLVPLKKAE